MRPWVRYIAFSSLVLSGYKTGIILAAISSTIEDCDLKKKKAYVSIL